MIKCFVTWSFVFRFVSFEKWVLKEVKLGSNVYSMEHDGKKALAPDR